MVRTITPSPLPALDSPRTKNLRLNDGPYRRGYDMILRAERHVTERNAGEDIMPARVTGYLLLEFDARPDLFGAACASIVKQVTSPLQGFKKKINMMSSSRLVNCIATDYSVCVRSTGSPKLFDINSRFKVRRPTVPYPPPSSQSSRPDFDEVEDMIMDCFELTGKDYKTSRRKVRVSHTTFSFSCTHRV